MKIQIKYAVYFMVLVRRPNVAEHTKKIYFTLQGKALLKFIEAISEKTLRSTVVMTAARGRGKSAALGLAMASAVAFG